MDCYFWRNRPLGVARGLGGLMLLFSGLLGVCSWIVEIVIVRQIPGVWRIAKKSTKASVFISLITAFVISSLFGAEGIHLLLASMIAVVLSHVTYRVAGKGGTIYERFNKTLRGLGEKRRERRARREERSRMVSDRKDRYHSDAGSHRIVNPRSDKDSES